MFEKIVNSDIYYVRYNGNCFLMYGQQLRGTIEYLNETGVLSVEDIAHNFYQTKFEKSDTFCYQQMYDIKYIEFNRKEENNG